MNVCKRLELIKERIKNACHRAGRESSEVLLLGASKTVSASKIEEFYRCGLNSFGENRVQEFLPKYEKLRELSIDWHFIGRLQSNKVKYLLGKVSLIHSVDRVSLVDEIQKRAEKLGLIQRVLIEVNLGGEESKGGIGPQETEQLAEYILSRGNIKLEGLMSIPPYREDPEEVRPFFSQLRELRNTLEDSLVIKLPTLSMGMSGDFEVAIEEGATIVRIGTALFGERG